MDDMVSAVALLKPKGELLLSTGELLPVAYFKANGEPTKNLNEAATGTVVYGDMQQTFPVSEIDQYSVH